jgi:hypothetical protein
MQSIVTFGPLLPSWRRGSASLAAATGASAACVKNDGAAASATGSVMVVLRKFRREVENDFSFIEFIEINLSTSSRGLQRRIGVI